MGNIVPRSTPQILERTLDSVRLRANSNGECFGGEIMDAMREAGVALRADRLEILLIDDSFDHQLLGACDCLIERRSSPLQVIGQQMDRAEQIDGRVRVRHLPQCRPRCLRRPGIGSCRAKCEQRGERGN